MQSVCLLYNVENTFPYIFAIAVCKQRSVEVLVSSTKAATVFIRRPVQRVSENKRKHTIQTRRQKPNKLLQLY